MHRRADPVPMHRRAEMALHRVTLQHRMQRSAILQYLADPRRFAPQLLVFLAPRLLRLACHLVALEQQMVVDETQV